MTTTTTTMTTTEKVVGRLSDANTLTNRLSFRFLLFSYGSAISPADSSSKWNNAWKFMCTHIFHTCHSLTMSIWVWTHTQNTYFYAFAIISSKTIEKLSDFFAILRLNNQKWAEKSSEFLKCAKFVRLFTTWTSTTTTKRNEFIANSQHSHNQTNFAPRQHFSFCLFWSVYVHEQRLLCKHMSDSKVYAINSMRTPNFSTFFSLSLPFLG